MLGSMDLPLLDPDPELRPPHEENAAAAQPGEVAENEVAAQEGEVAEKKTGGDEKAHIEPELELQEVRDQQQLHDDSEVAAHPEEVAAEGVAAEGVAAQGAAEEEAAENETDGDEEEYIEPELELQEIRDTHKERLKSRFEGIFAKYERDFTGVGDEIDIETGEIVVDNGHLANLQQELDSGASSQFLKDFAENLEHGDEDESSGGSGSSDESDDENDESDADMEDADSTSGGTQAEIPLDPLLEQLRDAAAGNVAANPLLAMPHLLEDVNDARSINTEDVQMDVPSRASEESESRSNASVNVLDMPALQETLLAFKTQSKGGRTIDSDAIQKLGTSIANQITQVLGIGTRSKSKKTREKKRKDPIWDYPELPVDKRRRVTADAIPQQPSLPLLEAAMSPRTSRRAAEPRESLWAPIRHPKPQRRRRPAGAEPAPVPAVHARPAPVTPPAAFDDEDAAIQLQDELQNDSDDAPALRKCYNCGICATTRWRRGPEGDLCCACGMYLWRWGLMKPPRPTTPEIEPERDDSHYSANTSRRLTGFAAKVRRFTPEEDALVIKLKEYDRLSWEKIGRHFAERSAFAVQCRYAKQLIGRPSAGRDALIEQGFSFENGKAEFRDDGFTDQDDELLVQLRDESKLDWTAIAERTHGQTAESVEARYNLLMGNYSKDAELGLRRAPNLNQPIDMDRPARASHSFQTYELELIVRLREIEKLPWAAVAMRVPGRSGLAVQKRYVRELERRKAAAAKGEPDPYAHLFDAEEELVFEDGNAGEERLRLEEQFVSHASLTVAEETLLMRLKDEEGLGWEDIVDRMPGRSALVLRNRYQVIQAKRADEQKAAAEAAKIYDLPLSEGSAPCVNAYASPYPKLAKDFTPAEDKLISELRNGGLQDWGRMSLHFPGRSAYALERRWINHLRNQRVSQPGKSEAGIEPVLVDTPMEVVQDDSLGSIDPSLAPVEPTVPRQETSVAQPHERPTVGCSNIAETGPQANTNSLAYTPAKGGSEVSHDPYQHVAVRNQQSADALTQQTLPKAKAGSKYSLHEHDTVAKLRADGLDWEEISARLPGRSAKSVYGHWKAHLGGKNVERNRTSTYTSAAKAAENPLLRQALNTGARRQPDGSAPYTGPDPRGAIYDIPKSVTPSIMLPGTTMLSGAAPMMNLFHSLLQRSPGRAAAVLSSPIRGGPSLGDADGHEPQRTTTLLPSALPSAPSPSVLSPSAPSPSAAVNRIEKASEVVSVRVASSAAGPPDSRAETPDSFVSAAESQGTIPDDSDHQDGGNHFDNAPSFPETPIRPAGSPQHTFESTPPRVISPFQPTPAPVTSYYTPAKYNQHAMPYFAAPTAPMYSPMAHQHHTQATPSHVVADPDNEMATVSRARARRSWTPVIDPPEPSDDGTVDMSDAENDEKPEELPTQAGATLGPDEPPPFSWNDLITMALKSSSEQRLALRDIYSYLEEKFPYFRACGNGWKTTLRQRLSMSDDFDSRGSGLAALWSFAENTSAYVEPKRRPVRPRKRDSSELAHTGMADTKSMEHIREEAAAVHKPVAQDRLVEGPAVPEPVVQEPPVQIAPVQDPPKAIAGANSDVSDIRYAGAFGRPAQNEVGRALTTAQVYTSEKLRALGQHVPAPKPIIEHPNEQGIEVASPLEEATASQNAVKTARGLPRNQEWTMTISAQLADNFIKVAVPPEGPAASQMVTPAAPKCDAPSLETRRGRDQVEAGEETTQSAHSSLQASMPTTVPSDGAEDQQQVPTSDIFRDPESTPAATRTPQKVEELRQYLAEHTDSVLNSDEADEMSDGEDRPQCLAKLQAEFHGRAPSSPGFVSAFSEPKRPMSTRIYGKSTAPKTPAQSCTADSGRQRASTEGPTSATFFSSRPQMKSNSRAGSVSRKSRSSMQLVDGSEDELA